MKHMKLFAFVAAVLAVVAIVIFSYSEHNSVENTATAIETSPEKQYYGFYQSRLGSGYKRLQHDLLGFSIDIPNDWHFGVNGADKTAVVIIYPEHINTAFITENYETLEIGVLPFTGISLVQAYDMIVAGMMVDKRRFNLIDRHQKTDINNLPAIHFSYTWQSKTGVIIKEWVNLIEYHNQIRSVTFRSAENIFENRKDLYQIIVNSFDPI